MDVRVARTAVWCEAAWSSDVIATFAVVQWEAADFSSGLNDGWLACSELILVPPTIRQAAAAGAPG